MAMKLLDLYRSILAVANMVPDSDGFINAVLAGDKVPVMLNGKRLVLPTKEILATEDRSNIVVFHPLAENVFNKESEVLEKFRTMLNITLNMKFNILMTELLRIATSPAEHKKLSPDQQEFLSAVKNADEQTYDVFKKLIEAMPAKQTQKQSVNLYLKRTGTVAGKKYHRVGVVSFPLYNELKASTKECYGVKMRVKDRETLMKLMEYMIPDIAVPEKYNRGSQADTAPYLDSLMKAVMAVGAPINDQLELFRSVLGDEETDGLLFNSEWVETFDDIDQMKNQIRMVPPQAGNDGVNSDAPTPTATPAATPAPTPAPVAVAGTGLPWQTQLLPGMGNRPQVQAQPAQPAGIRHTADGKLDFMSVVQSNPVLAMAVMGGQPATGFQQAPRMPRWAMPNTLGVAQPTGVSSYQTPNQAAMTAYRPII